MDQAEDGSSVNMTFVLPGVDGGTQAWCKQGTEGRACLNSPKRKENTQLPLPLRLNPPPSPQTHRRPHELWVDLRAHSYKPI